MTVIEAALECCTAVRVNPVDAMPYTLDLTGLSEAGLVLYERPGSRLPECSQVQDLRMRVGGIPFQFESVLLQRNDDGSSLWSLPLFMSSGEGRSHMRINVPTGFGLRGELALAKGGAKFEVIDVSHIGAKVRLFEESGEPGVSAASIQAIIQEATNIALLDGSIMWRTGDTCGLLFPEMRKVNPADTLNPWIRICHRVLLAHIVAQPMEASAESRSSKK